MQSFYIDNSQDSPLSPMGGDHQSEEEAFNQTVIQDDHELYYIHHYIDSMREDSVD